MPPRHRRRRRTLRILAGLTAMIAVVVTLFAVVFHYAGSWGVPYFTFTNERGSICKNSWSGYTCDPMTLADLEYYAEIDLPDDAVLTKGTYVATHDYQIDATVSVPSGSAAAALASLHEAFGKCLKGHASTLDTTGLKSVCVMSNDATITTSGDPDSRIYLVGTGVTGNGSRQIALSIRSR